MIDLDYKEQSIIQDVHGFIGSNWYSFLEYMKANGLTAPSEDEFEAVFEKLEG